MTYEENSEFERLKHADVAQGKRVAELTAELARASAAQANTDADLLQARLDLISSDAIRSALVQQTCDVAKDIARALGAVEAAFHAGYVARVTGSPSPEEGYRDWLKKLAERS